MEFGVDVLLVLVGYIMELERVYSIGDVSERRNARRNRSFNAILPR